MQSGGRAGSAATSLAAYLARMEALTNSRGGAGRGGAGRGSGNSGGSEAADEFNFDADFVRGLPELAGDFEVPALFRRWAGAGKRGVSDPAGGGGGGGTPAWSILSLGASRAGLPWHAHGETWLGLVFGKKRWFLYPPDREAPLEVGTLRWGGSGSGARTKHSQ